MNTLLKERARKLSLKAMLANWERYEKEAWLEPFIEAEEKERDRASLERRIKGAHTGFFKPMSEFDWTWADEIDRQQVEDLFTLNFMDEQANVVLIGTNGVGKSMIAQNLVHHAIMNGVSSARFVKASEMLDDLLEHDGSANRRRCLQKWCKVGLLAIDEVGYMNYDNRYADLLYEVISGRYQKRSTIVTTNRGYVEWAEIFPNAACVVTLVDRLVHNAETVIIKGESYRVKEAKEKAEEKKRQRKQVRVKK
jgi:DNA replication protein DnaC